MIVDTVRVSTFLTCHDTEQRERSGSLNANVNGKRAQQCVTRVVCRVLGGLDDLHLVADRQRHAI